MKTIPNKKTKARYDYAKERFEWARSHARNYLKEARRNFLLAEKDYFYPKDKGERT